MVEKLARLYFLNLLLVYFMYEVLSCILYNKNTSYPFLKLLRIILKLPNAL